MACGCILREGVARCSLHDAPTPKAVERVARAARLLVETIDAHGYGFTEAHWRCITGNADKLRAAIAALRGDDAPA